MSRVKIKCNFEFALCSLKNGKRVYREGDECRWIIMDKKNKDSPCLIRRNENGSFQPWQPSQLDIFAEDWFIEYIE